MLDKDKPSHVSDPIAAVTIAPRRGFFEFWLNLTAPPQTIVTNAYQREKLRKAEITSYIVLFFCVLGVLSIPLASQNIQASGVFFLITGFLTYFLLLALVAAFNRKGWTQAAAVMLVSDVIVVIMVRVLVSDNSPAGILLPTYDSFAYVIVIGSMILHRRFIFPFTLVAIGFITLDLLLAMHAPDMVALISSPGNFMITLSHPVILLLILAFGGWLDGRSIERAILQADRAEELAAAERKIADQTRLILEQKERLEAGIDQILQVHREIANGNFAARAPLHEDHELWQIGRALNILLARFERLAQESQELALTRADINQIAEAIQQVRHNQTVQFPSCSSPLGQMLLFALGAPMSHGPTSQPSEPPRSYRPDRSRGHSGADF